jgi:hypothetical protein
MPLLNPPDILPEAMRYLLRALLASPDGSAQATTLVALVSPAGMVEAMKSLGTGEEPEEGEESPAGGGRKIAEASLSALQALELVESDGAAAARTVTLSPTFAERFADWKALTAPAFASFLRTHMFADQFLAVPDGGAAVSLDLAEALALLHLADEPLRPFVSFDGAERRFQAPQRAAFGTDRKRWPVTNKEQYQSFVRWSVYLGFAQPMPGSGRMLGLIPDASEVLVDHLAVLVPEPRPIGMVVADIGQLLPQLDRGAVQQRLRAEMGLADDDAWMSPGLSLTLNRLHLGKRVTFEQRSDTSVLRLQFGPVATLVSTVGPGKKKGA